MRAVSSSTSDAASTTESPGSVGEGTDSPSAATATSSLREPNANARPSLSTNMVALTSSAMDTATTWSSENAPAATPDSTSTSATTPSRSPRCTKIQPKPYDCTGVAAPCTA